MTVCAYRKFCLLTKFLCTHTKYIILFYWNPINPIKFFKQNVRLVHEQSNETFPNIFSIYLRPFKELPTIFQYTKPTRLPHSYPHSVDRQTPMAGKHPFEMNIIGFAFKIKQGLNWLRYHRIELPHISQRTYLRENVTLRNASSLKLSNENRKSKIC